MGRFAFHDADFFQYQSEMRSATSFWYDSDPQTNDRHSDSSASVSLLADSLTDIAGD